MHIQSQASIPQKVAGGVLGDGSVELPAPGAAGRTPRSWVALHGVRAGTAHTRVPGPKGNVERV